jgi:hypothetical protein
VWAPSFGRVSPYGADSPIAYERCAGHARAMEPLSSEPPDLVQVMIPRWVYNRIVTLLVAVQSGAAPEDYIVAVLEGHVRRLNL